ncbi:hypothetical protein ADU90_02120 [Clostridium botulinum]|uniref:Uncharacterized protein n=1 Tax=Clostridium botulinum C/D str. DC5 TaxID=1443128 RepID=A0A0A0ILB2_CLOBO|nr:hypothetical protein [Clostridium botulinum]KEI01614.1 hypothetical protein Z952_12285 [Clostridium botulinum C/D str. BKT75002]KEI07948.1 hypothetical protein Z954_03420 [Clostridium botulinum C/D str. BKT2873]KGM94370.1 hypothetical protein Z956_07575 [Clostridium botulinum D str. CCUG 7971]KGN00366.1 hypothetical protein Z955_04080 [Clostridium botulinum C/D str. DC5]KOC50657.1 hypothetical protein ADU88_01925 [Clostridium botulinum]
MNSSILKFLLISLGINMLNNKHEKNNKLKNKLSNIPNFRGVLELKHGLPGRIRFYAPILKGNQELKEQVLQQINRISAINNVDINTITGSLLINYKQEEIEPMLLIGVLLKLMNLENEIGKEPVPILKKEIVNLKDSINLAIYDKTQGVIDGKTIITLSLIILGVYTLKNKNKMNVALPGLNYIWWAYTSIKH